MKKYDELTKINCLSCEESFLASDYVLKKKGIGSGDGCFCPYCGSRNTEAIVWSGDNLDFADEMGCLAISHWE
jgi:NAD-dependent SIR2 family protein deacetylase